MNNEMFIEIHRHIITNYMNEGNSLSVLTDEEFNNWYFSFVNTYFEMRLTDILLIRIRYDIWDENIKAFPIIEIRLSKIWKDRIAKVEADKLNITIDKVQYLAIAKCDVLWLGWECDPTAWVVEKDGKHQLVSTDHGTHQFYSKEFLEDRISVYKQAIIDSEKLLSLLD